MKKERKVNFTQTKIFLLIQEKAVILSELNETVE